MKTHYLNVEKVSNFKDIFNFFYKNEIAKGDEVVVDEGNSCYDYIHRQVMYQFFREGLNRYDSETSGIYYKPIKFKNIAEFFSPSLLAEALTRDTGRNFTVKKGKRN